jgi:hypothetical protein
VGPPQARASPDPPVLDADDQAGERAAEEYGRRNGVPGEPVIRVRPTGMVAVADVADGPAETLSDPAWLRPTWRNPVSDC